VTPFDYHFPANLTPHNLRFIHDHEPLFFFCTCSFSSFIDI